MEERCRRCPGVTAALGAAATPGCRSSGANGQTGNRRAFRDHRHPLGVGIVKATPDTAEFSFGVETQGATSTGAPEERRRGEEGDRRDQGGRRRGERHRSDRPVFPRYTEDGTTIVGYTAVNTVGVKVRNLGKAGEVVDAAVKAGANQVYGPTLTISGEKGLYNDALQAFADAKSKAQTIGGAAKSASARSSTSSRAAASRRRRPPRAPRTAAAASRSSLAYRKSRRPRSSPSRSP